MWKFAYLADPAVAQNLFSQFASRTDRSFLYQRKHHEETADGVVGE